jgi:hypothetical protein
VTPALSRTLHHSRRRAATVAIWAIWTVSAVFLVAGLVTARPGGPNGPLTAFGLSLAALSFATAGAILVSRLPANVIGWLLASGGFCFALGSGAPGLADVGLIVHPGSVPGAIWFAWVGLWIWAPAIGVVTLLALVYPSGRLLSARWRPVALAAVLIIALVSLVAASAQGPIGSFPVQNPLVITGGIADILGGLLDVLFGPALLLFALVALLAVTSLVLRYRRAAGVERAQLKWFAAAAALSVPAVIVGTATFGMDGVAGIVSKLANFVAFLGFALLPVAIGIAVLRYRLYEIDRLISRTIGWAVVTALTAGLFAAVIVVLQAVLAPLTQSNALAVAASTLLVFTIFQPLRRRVQWIVDRRFNRARYDAGQTVAAFAGRLRDEIDLAQLRADITVVVDGAVEPASVSIWLRKPALPWAVESATR